MRTGARYQRQLHVLPSTQLKQPNKHMNNFPLSEKTLNYEIDSNHNELSRNEAVISTNKTNESMKDIH